MKKFSLFLSIVFIMISLAWCSYENKPNANSTDVKNTELRIGWQIPWSIQGQIVQVFKHTDILKENWLNATFKWFLYGAPLNEAALAWDVDVILTADQPAAVLLSKNPNWIIAGRLMYNRVSLYVPASSETNSMSGLVGKKIWLPFWAAVQRMVLREIKNNWFEPNKNIFVANLWMDEQMSLMKNASGALNWWDFYAMGGFDPAPAIMEEKWFIKTIKEDKIVAVVLVSKKLQEKDSAVVDKLLKSLTSSWEYYKTNKNQVNSWFNEESGLMASTWALEITEKFEPNFTSEIRNAFNSSDIEIMQDAVNFLYNQKLITNNIKITDFIYPNSLLK